MENKLILNVIWLLTCLFLISCLNNQNNNEINSVNTSLYKSHNNTKHIEETKIATDDTNQKQKQTLENDNLIQKKDKDFKTSKKVIISELNDNISSNYSLSQNLLATNEENLDKLATNEENLDKLATNE